MDHPIYLYYKLKKIKITFFNTISMALTPSELYHIFEMSPEKILI